MECVKVDLSVNKQCQRNVETFSNQVWSLTHIWANRSQDLALLSALACLRLKGIVCAFTVNKYYRFPLFINSRRTAPHSMPWIDFLSLMHK